MRTLHAILSLGLTLFLLPSYGQEDNPRIPAEITNLQVSINILEPSVVIEKMVTEKNTFTLSAGITTLNQFNEDFDASKFTINPQVRSSFRHYYPRKKVEKVLRPNSGNYIGLAAGYTFRPVAENAEPGITEESNSFFMGGLWGIQRNYPSGIHLGLSIGGGFAAGQNVSLRPTGVGSFELGFVIK